MEKQSKEMKELIKKVRAITGIPFASSRSVEVRDNTLYLYQEFGEKKNENALSLRISPTECEVGLYDVYNEHSIYRTSRDNMLLCLDIARHIYKINNY